MTTATAAPTTQTQTLKLYELPDAIREIESAIIEAEGEVTDEIADRLDHLEGEFERKAEYIGLLAREAKAEAASWKQEEERLKARRTAAENREKRLKDYLLMSCQRLGTEKVKGSRCEVSVRRNPQPSIRWMGEDDAIPEAYRVVSVRPDLRRAKDELRAGAELPEGFTAEYGFHVRIR